MDLFLMKWRLLFWKALLVRIHCPITTSVEILLPIIFILQIRWMYDPLAADQEAAIKYTKKDIYGHFPKDTHCYYTPKNSFTDNLMSRASKLLGVQMEPAESEKDLVVSYYTDHNQSKHMWAIFDEKFTDSLKPNILEYKIRSSEVGHSTMIMMQEDEPADEDPYITSGFMAFQMAIEDSFLETWKNPNLPEMGKEFAIGRFPFYRIDFLIMPTMVRPNISVIYYMTVIAFLLIPIATLQKLVHDKETGFRGLLIIMDMSYAILHFGWLNYLMISAFPVSIICAVILHRIFSHSHTLLVMIFIIVYIILSALFMFAFGAFFSNSMKAILSALLFWLFLAHFTVVLDQSLAKASYALRILSLVLPHSGLLYGLITFTSRSDLYENQRAAANEILSFSRSSKEINWESWWTKITQRFLLRDVHDIVHAELISINVIIIFWILQIIFWFFFVVYLDNVNSDPFSSAKPWYYLFKQGPSRDVAEGMLGYRGSTNWSAVERTLAYVKPAIRLRCVSLKFGDIRETITAVNQVTIDFYRQEFTIILGHNGAGKSCLLKIITGMYKPTYGHVYVEGIDHGEEEDITIGYCPQENILVNYLTTMQHIYLFGMFRGLTWQAACEQADDLIDRLDLRSVKESKINNCSFGTRRRICLAMALIGKSKILILDEPICGLDPVQRSQIWSILSEIRRTKTIIMVTNSMEAADLLADRIAIIANGMIQCYGTKMYLNRRYGIGYVLCLLVHENCDLERLQMEIQAFFSEPVTIRSKMGLVIRFDVPRNSKLTRLLQYLEINKESLDIVSVSLSSASIEGQFLRIGLASRLRERNIRYPGNMYELIAQKRRQEILRSGKPWERLSGRTLKIQQIVAMFYKKFLHVWVSWNLYMFSLTMTIIAFLLTMMLSELSSFPFFAVTEKVMNLTKYVDNNLFVLYHAVDDKDAKNFLVVLCATGQSYSDRRNYHVSKNITASNLMILPDLHSIELRDRYLMSIDIHRNGFINLLYSSTAVHSGPIAINLLHNALLHYHRNSTDGWIKATSRPLVDPKTWQHRLIHPRSVRNWENAAIIVTFLLILPTVDLGIREKSSMSKLLQTNTMSMTTLTYWIPIYIIDFLIYMGSILFLTLLALLLIRNPIHVPTSNIVQLIIIIFSYGAAAIPFGYCIQLFTTKAEQVYLAIILINMTIVFLVNGSLIFPTIFRIIGDRGKYLFETLLHIFPPYVLSCALSNFIVLSNYNQQCSLFNTCDTEFRVEDPCCQNCGDEGCYKPFNAMFVEMSGDSYHHSVIDDVILMLLQMFAFHFLLEVFEEKNRRKWKISDDAPEQSYFIRDQTVREESGLVDEYLEHYREEGTLPPGVTFITSDLKKKYGKKTALHGISFSIKPQECFGLLGINGAGKSTVYRILAGHTKMQSGDAILYQYDLKKQIDMFVGMIGYCPQKGGLSEFMTGRQYLKLHAALRGVPRKSIAEEIDKWLDSLDLLDFENLKIKNCPWGIQRKFCVLQSLVGNLPIVFMDEPSSGIDVIAAHAMCEISHHVREMGRTVLVTTQNMREAEAMCVRVGILVDGKFVAIDSCERLSGQAGSKFILSIKVTAGLPRENLSEIEGTIEDTFPEIVIRDRHSIQGILTYEFRSHIPYANVFDQLEKLRKIYPWIIDFTVTQPSMDQVFLELAKLHKQMPSRASFYERLRNWSVRYSFR